MCSIYTKNNQKIIKPDGDLNIENSEKFRLCILELFNKGETLFCFDLLHVEDISFQALLILIALSNQIKTTDKHIKIVNANSTILQLLTLSKIIETNSQKDLNALEAV